MTYTLDLRTELNLNAWTDISSYVYGPGGETPQITVARGRPDELSQAQASRFNATLTNTDGRFSDLNPTGAYYPYLVPNTPVRVSVPNGSTYLRLEDDRTSYASTPDSAGISITTDTEIQIDTELTNYTATTLASKWNATGNQRSWILVLQADGTLRFLWSPDGSGGNALSATSTVSLPLGRAAVKVTLAVATSTVTFYTAPTIAGPWAQFGTATTLPNGFQPVFDSTAPLLVGYQADDYPVNQGSYSVQGKVFEFRLLSGIGGTLKANPVFSAQTAGTTSWADAQGNTWTLAGTAVISDRMYRYHGEMSAWPPQWGPSGTDVRVPVTGGGILRRLRQGGSPLASAMRRGYLRLTGGQVPLAYWPCEEGSGATQIASGISGPAMLFTGTPQFAADSSFLCSDPIPTIGSSTWSGIVPKYTNPASPVDMVQFLWHAAAGNVPDTTVIVRYYTTGTVKRVDLQYGVASGGSLQLSGYDASGTQLFASGYVAFALDGDLIRLSAALETSGSNVIWHIDSQQVNGSQVGLSGTVTTASVGRVTSVIVNPGAANCGSAAAGHFSVQSFYTPLADLASQLNAWQGETAATRFARLCAEEGIAYRVIGYPSTSVAMGPQLPDTLVNLLQQCEDTDCGMIFEPRQALALGYRTLVSLCSQSPAVTFDYTQDHLAAPLEPTRDDQKIRNDVTVQQASGGSSSRQTLDTGAMSTQPPPNGVGRYDTSQTVSLFAASLLDDEAGWRLHIGTVNDARYPVIWADMAATSTPAAAQQADIGDYVQIANPPVWLPPGTIRQLAAGITEELAGYRWRIGFNAIPEQPYELGLVFDATYGHIDTDGSTLHANITSTATSMQVDTTNAGAPFPLWTTAAGDFPFDVIAGGEQMTVTAISGTSNPQTFTITRSVNGVVKAHTAGEDVRLAHPFIVALV